MDESFEWDEDKNRLNQQKQDVSFELAQYAFFDPKRVIVQDLAHSQEENRFYCMGQVDEGIITVSFTYREGKVRIFGAGYWRKGRKLYEQQNNLY
ncbi:BrnT family toxin [Microcystis aeruginosa LEGE 11464]|uniref:BrnT family toxin n=1 Tax=Microcystis aeruginosa TaxID=1126 RepID=UPI0018806557|nr:BrnT family toxin [Microcystis aeruginosa]MBE9091592.1 BrnT family toxin [Microcystis aeruginosa LEGE 11464]